MTILVTKEDIKYSEGILLKNNLCFDEGRIEFIKNLDTIDLQAVPGSGKTTALLAKLLILEKHLPLDDGSGILVISHTNAAIDEIKSRIALYCPKLFEYPNYVGTIQSFVDNFLTIPFYKIKYKKNLASIDTEIYRKHIYVPKEANLWLKKQSRSDEILYGSTLNENDELEIPRLGKGSETYESLLRMKKNIRDKGVLCFLDAYYLAKQYLNKYPTIIQILQKRFRFVFVDEMQDMDTMQCELLEKIFYDKGNSSSVFQRIGDRNQSIFSSSSNVKTNPWDYKNRNVIYISGSYRFSKAIADVVKHFSLDIQEIEGMSSHNSTKPHLLIFNDEKIKNVLPKFVEIIKDKQQQNEIPSNIKGAIKAAGWRKKHENDRKDKISIKSYCPQYDEVHTKNVRYYCSLIDYICDIKAKIFNNNNALRPILDNILNAFLEVLRIEKILDSEDRYYTKRKLLKNVENLNINFYKEFRLKLYLWSKNIYLGNIQSTYDNIKEYIPHLLRVLSDQNHQICQETKKFICKCGSGSKLATDRDVTNFEKSHNFFKHDGLEIEVATIHSIKGETHFATLYMETYFQGKCESRWLKESFKLKQDNNSNSYGEYAKKALKMAYVGMSRPRYLLCVAVNNENVRDYINEIPDDKWKKVYIF